MHESIFPLHACMAELRLVYCALSTWRASDFASMNRMIQTAQILNYY